MPEYNLSPIDSIWNLFPPSGTQSTTTSRPLASAWNGTMGALNDQSFTPYNFFNYLKTLTGGSAATGYGTLADILASQGKTDPALFNRNLSDIVRGGEGIQQAMTGQLASRGLANSGVGLALKQAGMGATENRVAAAKANEAALQEQRKRADLELLMRMFIQPSLDTLAMKYGVPPSAPTPSTWEKIAGAAGDLAPLIGMLM